MKFDLPRKRKKRYKTTLGSLDYMSMKILNEILWEEDGKLPKYPKWDDKNKVIGKW